MKEEISLMRAWEIRWKLEELIAKHSTNGDREGAEMMVGFLSNQDLLDHEHEPLEKLLELLTNKITEFGEAITPINGSARTSKIVELMNKFHSNNPTTGGN